MIWGDLGKGTEGGEGRWGWLKGKNERAKELTKADEESLYFFFLSLHCRCC